MTANSILVKAFIRQLFGSPDIQMLEFDTENSGIEDLRQEISSLVGGRGVTLSWLDGDGDHIRLSNDKQLKFAVTHGVKDNILRVSVRVDWMGGDCSRRQQIKDEATADDGEAAQATGDETTASGELTGAGSAEAPAKRAPSDTSKTHYSGYVRTVGPDGVARERNLTAEEAAYLLQRSHVTDFPHFHSPFSSLGGSMFHHPRIDFQHPFRSPLYLGW